MSDLPDLMISDDLGRLLHIGAHAAAEMCRRGVVPATKLGRRWVIRKEALLDHLKREEKRNQSPRAARRDPAAAVRVLSTVKPSRRTG